MVKSGQTKRKAASRTKKIERKAAGVETKMPSGVKSAKKSKTTRKSRTTEIVNSVKGRELEPRWPVNLVWVGYVLVAVYLLMLGPGALILYYMMGADALANAMIAYGMTVIIGVVSLVVLILGMIGVVQTYLKASHRMREVVTLTGGAAGAMLVGYWLTYATPFHSTESYVIMFSLVALLPGVIAAMFRWLMPTFEVRRELQKVVTVLTVIVLAIEIVLMVGTVVAAANTMAGLESEVDTVTESILQSEEAQENAE